MRILIVDDEKTARYGMKKSLDPLGRVDEADSLESAREYCREEQPDIVLLDLNLGGENGLDLLEDLQNQEEPAQVIIITAHGSEKVAVEAMKKGAFDYLAKPFDIDELRLVVRHAWEQIELRDENRRLREALAAGAGYGSVIGRSPQMEKVYGLIEKVAGTDVTILITGESGSGKELVAREIHRRSPRARRPLITVNCAAIPENLIESELFGHERGSFTGATERRIGKFEQGRNGSLFLDEIGDMPLDTQAKILRALEERKIQRVGGQEMIDVDVRIISATNKDLHAMVDKGEFREDLYYRLEVVHIHIPPLRWRREDIPLLITYFRDQFGERHNRPAGEISPGAMTRLVNYSYPGNVRQLRNIMERLVVLNSDPEGLIREKDLPDEVRFFFPSEGKDAAGMSLEPFLEMNFKTAREAFETRYLLWKLREHNNNITHTAESIGIHRQSLQQKMRDLNLRPLIEEE